MWLTLLLLVPAIVTGCTAIVDGAAQPAPGLAPRPVDGQQARRILLDSATLSSTFGHAIAADPNSPVRSGGPEMLYPQNGTPQECVGVPSMLLANSYTASDVRNIVRGMWVNTAPYEQHPVVSLVEQGVVTFRTAADADKHFEASVRTWKHCDGATVDWNDDYFTFAISKVQEENSVLSATVAQHGSTTVPVARAIGLRVNCIIEVDVAYLIDDSRYDTSPRRAIEMVRTMMARVSALS